MAKTIICLVLTLVFSFLSYNSFMSNDYRPLQQWMAYYKEYKELQGALDKGDVKKAELLSKLKRLYPEKAQQIEEMARSKYIDLSEEARQTEADLRSSRRSDDSQTRQEPVLTQQRQSTTQTQRNNETTRSNTTSNTSNTANSNNANNKSKQ